MLEPVSGGDGPESLAGSSAIVAGLGSSGCAAASRLLELGARVLVTDVSDDHGVRERASELRAAGAEVEIGTEAPGHVDADFAVASPGIPPHAPVIEALHGAGVEIWSEVELAYRIADADFLAVTGTNGKTTTTGMLAAMLYEAGIPSLAAGNIGTPLVDAVGRVGRGGAIAVELSSFQLAAIHRFRPRIAVVLNVSEDHTDWHGSFEAYMSAKARIVMNQTGEDFFLPNHDDPRARAIGSLTAAAVVPFSALGVPQGGIGQEDGLVRWHGRPVFSNRDVPVGGRAVLEDAIAAAGAALLYGVDEGAVARGLRRYRPAPHRLELVAEADGVRYIDDSKATNPHATLAAVDGLQSVVLIAGGRSKGIDLSVLAGTVPPVVAVVALGEAAGEIRAAFGDLVPVEIASNMSEAVRRARTHAIPGGSVLLSPSCASLDMYDSYAQRGDDFAAQVRELLSMPRSDGSGESGG